MSNTVYCRALTGLLLLAMGGYALGQTVEYKLQVVDQMDPNNVLEEGSGIGGAFTQNDIDPDSPFTIQILAKVVDPNCGIVQTTVNLREPHNGWWDHLAPVQQPAGFWGSMANPLFDLHLKGEVDPNVGGTRYDVYQDTAMLFAQPESPIGESDYDVLIWGAMQWDGWSTALGLNQDGGLLNQHLVSGLDCQDDELCPIPPQDILGDCIRFQRLNGTIYWKPEQCADDCEDVFDDWCHPGNWQTVGLEPENRLPECSDIVVVDWDCEADGPDVPLAFGGPCFPEQIAGVIVGEYGTGRVRQINDQDVCVAGHAVVGMGSLLANEGCDDHVVYGAKGLWTQNSGATSVGGNLYMGIGLESQGAYEITDGILTVCDECDSCPEPVSEIELMVCDIINGNEVKNGEDADPNGWGIDCELDDSIYIGVLGQGELRILGDGAGTPKVIANSILMGEQGAITSSGSASVLRFNRMCGPGVAPENVNVAEAADSEVYGFSGTWEIGHQCGEQAGYFGLCDEDLALGNSLVVGLTREAMFDQYGQSDVTIARDLVLGYAESVSGVYNLDTEGCPDDAKQGEYCDNECPPDLEVGGDAYVGFEGSGEFNHGTGNVRVDQNLEIGYHPTAEGVYTMDGLCEETCLDVGCDTVVGNRGVGEFNQIAGLHKVGDNLEIGYWDTGSGVYNLYGGCLNVENGMIRIGYRGVGEFNMEAGRNCVATVIADEINKGENGQFNTTGTSGIVRVNRFVGFEDEALAISNTLQLGHLGGAGEGQMVIGDYPWDPNDPNVSLVPDCPYVEPKSVSGLTVGKHLTVGYDAPASVYQYSGSVDVARNVYVGSAPGVNDPYASLSGADGSYVKCGGDLVVGRTIYVGGGTATGSFTQYCGLTQAPKVVVDNLNSSGEFHLMGGRFETREFHGKLTNTGATVAVLGDPGVMTVYGPMEQEPNGVTELRIREADCDPDFRVHDRICVSQSADLSGTLLLDTEGYDPEYGDQFCLLSASAGINGFYDLVTGGFDPADPEIALAVVLAGLDDNCVKAVATMPGDINLDFVVDAVDLQLFGANWDPTAEGKTWIDGDFNGDGLSDAVDLQLLGLNWCREYTPPCPPFDFDCCDDCFFCIDRITAVDSVPEPATFSLIAMGALALVRRRR